MPKYLSEYLWNVCYFSPYFQFFFFFYCRHTREWDTHKHSHTDRHACMWAIYLRFSLMMMMMPIDVFWVVLLFVIQLKIKLYKIEYIIGNWTTGLVFACVRPFKIYFTFEKKPRRHESVVAVQLVIFPFAKYFIYISHYIFKPDRMCGIYVLIGNIKIISI